MKNNQIAKLRKILNTAKFGSAEWNKASEELHAIRIAEAEAETEEFCSIDSGIHRTRLLSGKII